MPIFYGNSIFIYRLTATSVLHHNHFDKNTNSCLLVSPYWTNIVSLFWFFVFTLQNMFSQPSQTSPCVRCKPTMNSTITLLSMRILWYFLQAKRCCSYFYIVLILCLAIILALHLKILHNEKLSREMWALVMFYCIIFHKNSQIQSLVTLYQL